MSVSVGDTRAVEPLIAVLDTTDDYITRTNTIKALGNLGDRRALQPLQLLIEDFDKENYNVQIRITGALVRLGDSSALDRLKKELSEGPSLGVSGYDHGCHLTAWYEFADIGVETIPVMMDILRNTFQPEDSSRAYGLGNVIGMCFTKTMANQFGAIAVQPLLQELSTPRNNPRVKNIIIEALGRIGDPRAIRHLAEALHHPEFIVRIAAIEAFSKIETPIVIESLIGALMDADSFIRGEAAHTLGVMKAREAVPVLERLLSDDELKHDYGEPINVIAARALVAIGTADAVDIAVDWFIQHLNDQRYIGGAGASISTWSATQLEIIGTEKARSALREFRKDL